MQRIERIVLAVDFSPASRAALRQAIYVAQRSASEIFLVHAIEQLPHAASVYQAMNRRIYTQLERMRTEMVQRGIRVVPPPIVERGEAIEVICSTANRLHANLIMLGAGEKRVMERFLLGSTAAKAIRQATQPVWVVKPSQTPPHIAKILCAVDFSDPAKRALRNAVLLSRTFRAELTVLHVVETDASRTPRCNAVADPPTADQKCHKLRAEIERLLRGYGASVPSVQILVCRGEPDTSILQTVRVHGCDLLVMGSVGRRGLSGLLIGNTAEQVVREVPCSLLTVKGEDVLRGNDD